MRVVTVNIGYRELDILSDFMHEIANHGCAAWGGDVPVAISYDLQMDRAVCVCHNGQVFTSDDIL